MYVPGTGVSDGMDQKKLPALSRQPALPHATTLVDLICVLFIVTLLEPQSAFGDKLLKFQVVCPQNGTAVLKGLIAILQAL